MMEKNKLLLTVLLIVSSFSGVFADDTVIELWDEVKPPAAVELQTIEIDVEKTAFLILDIEERTCNLARRPRCIDSVPAIAEFLKKSRKKGLMVIYSLTSAGTTDTILPEVKPLENEPVVKSSVDKFYNTELESILRAKSIETVIIAGTTAEGAVLHTATGASMRGFNVVIPVDGMSAADIYAEQYTAWHMLNAPGTRRLTKLTKFEMIKF
ncbi:MAG: cysteine hydrolase [Elusimicrobiota bacterium]